MNEITDTLPPSSISAEEAAHLKLASSLLTEALRSTAIEWYDWDVALEVIVAEDHSVSARYPAADLIEGRRRMQATVLSAFLLRNCRVRELSSH